MALFRRKAPPAPIVDEPESRVTYVGDSAAETALMQACDDADTAAEDLADALARRRAAIVQLVGVTDLSKKVTLNRLLTFFESGRGLWFAGCGEALGLPMIPPHHRSSFGAGARIAIDNSRAGRAQTAPADSGELMQEV